MAGREADKVEVKINSAENLDEVVIRASFSATLADLKEILAEQLNRPEIIEKGRFVRTMPNGDWVDISDKQKLGSRRVLAFTGAPLHPKEEEKIYNLEDFDPFDYDSIIGSPRSLQACDLEGVLIEDLYNTPLDEFTTPGIPRRLAQLRHDFFEVVRTDTLSMVHKTRYMLIDEAEGRLPLSSVSGGSSLAAKREQKSTSHSQSVQSAFGMDSAAGFSETIAGAGGIWAGALSPQSYPMTAEFFAEVEKYMTPEMVCQGPAPMPDPNEAAPKVWSASQGARESVDTDVFEVIAGAEQWWLGITWKTAWNKTLFISGILEHSWAEDEELEVGDEVKELNGVVPSTLKTEELKKIVRETRPLRIKIKRTLKEDILEAEDRVKGMVDDLKGMKAGKQEVAAGLVLRTESIAVSQRQKNSQAMSKKHVHVRRMAKDQVEVAEMQTYYADVRHEDVAVDNEFRDDMFLKSRGPWTTGIQEKNAAAVKKGLEYWSERRRHVHQMELDAEARRREKIVQRAIQDTKRQKHVANMRDHKRIHFARDWLDRRIIWAKNNAEVSKGHSSYKKAILAKQSESEARVMEVNHRLRENIEFKREYKELRKTLKQMEEAREQRRRDFRRNAVSEELVRMASERSSMKFDDASDTLNQTNRWGNAGTRNSPLALSNGSRTFSDSSLTLTAGGSSSKVAKRLPRFDWCRFGSETLSLPGAHANTKTLTLMNSSSSPSLRATR